MRYVLGVAGIYNLSWGALAILAPTLAFSLAGMAQPNYPELWQCIGMIVGVYGVGYAIAAIDPFRHWPIVLVGLLGKIFGPIGFLKAATEGRMPWSLGWNIVANDLIWWVPFGLILYGAHRFHLGRKIQTAPEIQRMAMRSRTSSGSTLLDLSRRSPVLLVFLRHAGCTFCREALSDLAEQRRSIEENGSRIVIVHMSKESEAGRLFSQYGLADIDRVSDPNRGLYRAFGLERGGLWPLFGPFVWWRGFVAGILRGHGIGPLDGDGFQMPGAFVLYHGEILHSFIHESAADRPNYIHLASAVGDARLVG